MFDLDFPLSILKEADFKLPGLAFKLWAYCLLAASSPPEPCLQPDAVWLSYEGIREKLSESGKTISSCTISSALKCLEQNGYLRLERVKFKGIKAAVVPRSLDLVLEAVELEFGRELSLFERSRLAELQKSYSPAQIAEALTLAALQDKRSIPYIGGILQNRAGRNSTKPASSCCLIYELFE